MRSTATHVAQPLKPDALLASFARKGRERVEAALIAVR